MCDRVANQAAIKMSRGGTKEWLLSRKIAELAPPLQPDGRRSDECIARVIERALRAGSQSFEWTGLGYNDEKFPMEVTLTPIRALPTRLSYSRFPVIYGAKEIRIRPPRKPATFGLRG